MKKERRPLSIFTIIIIMVFIIAIMILLYDRFVANNENSNNETTQNIELNTDTTVQKNVVKKDMSKDYVYTYQTKIIAKIGDYTGGKYDVAVNIPIINLNSDDVDAINDEIKNAFTDRPTTNELNALYYLTYEYNISNDIISVLLTEYQGYDFMPNVRYYSYNIDLKTGNKVSLTEIVNRLGNDYSILNSKFKKLITDTKNELTGTNGNFSEEKLQGLNTYINLVDIDTYYISKEGILVWNDNIDVFNRLININTDVFLIGMKLDDFETKVETTK